MRTVFTMSGLPKESGAAAADPVDDLPARGTGVTQDSAADSPRSAKNAR
jgi:hypothetical protein